MYIFICLNNLNKYYYIYISIINMNLNTIALNNIIILNDLDLKKYHVDIKDKVFLEVLENKDDVDNFENIVELKNLEYCIYFSFHQLLQMPIRELIEDYTRKDLLNMMENGLNNIYRLYGKEVFSDENARIYNIMEEIDTIIFECKLKLRQNYCKFKMLDMFEYLLTGYKVYHNTSYKVLSLYNGINSSDSDDDVLYDIHKPYPFKDLEDNDDDVVNDNNDDDNDDDIDDDDIVDDDIVENDTKRQKLE